MSSDGEDANNTVRDTNVTVDGIPVDSMKVEELKTELKRRKLKTTGNKAALATRLKTALTLDSERDDSEAPDDEDVQATDEARRYIPTFKDVEESMNVFSADDDKSFEQ